MRKSTTEILGLVNVHYLLLYQTALFLCREPVRKTAARENLGGEISNTFTKNLLISSLCGVFWMARDLLEWKFDVANLFHISLVVFSVVLELMTESEYLELQKSGEISKSVKFLSISVVVKTVFGVGSVYLLEEKFHVTGLVVSFVVGSLVYFFLMKNVEIKNRIRIRRLRSFGNTFWFQVQCFLKQILTEAERYIITFSTILSLSDQGVFDIVSSLAALPSRFLFQPIEEAVFQYFSKIRNSGQKHQAKIILETCLQIVTGVAVTMAVFGEKLGAQVLNIYSGDGKLNSGVELLTGWCYYQIFIAVNGISEAYANAFMSQNHVKLHNLVYILSSVAVCITIPLAMSKDFKMVSFVLGNVASMSVRIIWNFYVIGRDNVSFFRIVAPGLVLFFVENLFTVKFWFLVPIVQEKLGFLNSELVELGFGAVVAGILLGSYLVVTLLYNKRRWMPKNMLKTE